MYRKSMSSALIFFLLTMIMKVYPCDNCYSGCSGGSCNGSCNPGYLKWWIIVFVCSPCSTGCLSCDGLLAIQCQSCQPGYYLSGGNSCPQCPTQCSTCTNPSTCSSCEDGYYIQGNSCPACDLNCLTCQTTSTYCLTCATKFYMDNNICYNCPTTCATCTSNDNCQTCTGANMSTNLCTCNSGYTVSGQSCLQCQFPCQTCSGSVSNCTACAQPNRSIPSCACSAGYYANSGSCAACPNPCAACSSAINCSSCKDALMNIVSGMCTCPNGTWNNNQVCTYCTSPCSNCSSATACQSCIDIHMTLTSGLCPCNSGYLLTGTTCQSCTNPCATCANSLTDCQTCVSPIMLLSSNPKCQCPIGQYQTANTCATCDSNCKTCLTLSTNCTSCQPGYYLNGSICSPCDLPCQTCDTNSNKCLSCIDANQTVSISFTCDCNFGYIPNGNYCNACTLPCTSCVTTITTCLSCLDPLQTLVSNECICNTGYGRSGFGCSVCVSPCLTCSSSVNSCQSCVDPSMYVLRDNMCICGPEYFTFQSQCQLCSPQCQTCQYYSDYCLTCKDINHILTNSNECICDIGYLTNAGHCSQCESPCFSCIFNAQYCTECQDILAYVDSDNKCKCKDGYYFDSNWHCLICDISCKTCSAQFTCLSCYEQYYLNNSLCEPCVRPCGYCLSQQQCLNCVDGYYQSGTNCNECQNGCLLCDNGQTCIFCQDGYFLNSMNKCQACILPCETCVQQDNFCLTCQNPNMIILNNTCTCQKGFYYFDNDCYQCISPCLLCNSMTQCTLCKEETSLILKNNQCICADGYFFNGSFCQICNQSCLTCIDNQNLCTSCDQKQNRILNEQSKTCDCIKNFFSQEDTMCQLCTDKNGIQLKECNYSNCGDGIWTWGEACDDGNDVARDGCSKCQIDTSYSCINTILEPSFCFDCVDNCLKCDQQQCQLCQIGYYLDNNSCNQCPDLCLNCNNQFLCQTCQYFELNGKCVECEAKKGYFLNSTGLGCISICGDGVKADTEQCDDGNQLDNDGCNNNCQLETDYLIENGIVALKSNLQPNLDQIYSSIYDPLRIFSLNYNEPIQFVDLKDQSLFQIQITNYQINQDFTYSIEDKSINMTTKLIKFNMTIKVFLNKSTQNKNLIIKFNDIYKFKNQDGKYQKQDVISCLVDKYILIDETTAQATQGAMQANYYILYIIISLIALSILFGGIEIFYNLLDLLQVVSYLQYINTQFPYNLDNYLNIFKFAQLQWLNQYISISSLYAEIIDESSLIQAPPKISNDGFNANFIINISSLITVWVTFIGTYLLAHLVSIILYRINIELQIESFQLVKWFKCLLILFKQYILKQCQIIKRSFFFSGFFRTYISTTYDFSFYLMLSLNGLTFVSSNLINYLSSLLTIFSIGLYLLIILATLKIMESKVNQLKNNIDSFGSVYEGLKLNGIDKFYNIFILVKKFLFMGSLILSYYDPLFQIVQILFLTLIQLIFLLLFKPIENKLEWKKQIYCEILMFVTEYMLMILVMDDVLQLFVYEIRNLLGWIIISSISLMLITQIIFDLRQQWCTLVKIYNKINHFIQKKFNFQGKYQLSTEQPNPNNLFSF